MNVLLLVAFLKDPLKCFRNSGTHLVMNLAVSDCLTCLFAPSFLVMYVLSRHVCKLKKQAKNNLKNNLCDTFAQLSENILFAVFQKRVLTMER